VNSRPSIGVSFAKTKFFFDYSSGSTQINPFDPDAQAEIEFVFVSVISSYFS
jgi:hypothetical protein